MSCQKENHSCPWPVPTLPVMASPVCQKTCAIHYSACEALLHGTFFPALFKPLHNCQLPIPACPVKPYQAWKFILQELRLYLDTHPDDPIALAYYDRLRGVDCEHVDMDALLDALNLPEANEQNDMECGRCACHCPCPRPCPPCPPPYPVPIHDEWLDDPWPWELAANACLLPTGGVNHVRV